MAREVDSGNFTAEERAAMKERAKEAKRAKAGADSETDVLEKIAAMPPADRAIAERLHALVKEHAPQLTPKTWYGMPAYAKDGKKIVCFFQSADKFKARYETLGFDETANLDEGTMWPMSWAITEMNAKNEKFIVELLTRAVDWERRRMPKDFSSHRADLLQELLGTLKPVGVATIGTMFRSPAIRTGGKIVAFLGFDGELIVKVPQERADELVKANLATAVTMRNRTMREWIHVPSGPDDDSTLAAWLPFAQEALEYVRSLSAGGADRR